MNGMVYSLIKVNFTINQQYIIENFCINTDKPELQCDGKCFLAEKIKAAKEQRESTPAMTFGQDFGVYIPNSNLAYSLFQTRQVQLHKQSFYNFHPDQMVTFEIDHPPKG